MRIDWKSLELSPADLRRFLTLAMGVWLWLAGPYGAPPAVAGLPEFQIAVLTMQLQFESDGMRDDQDELNSIVIELTNDLLPSIIEKTFSSRFQQYVWAERFDVSLPEEPSRRADLLNDFKARGVALLLWPQVNFSKRGISIRTVVYDFRSVSRIDANTRGMTVAVFMSPEVAWINRPAAAVPKSVR